MATRNIRIDTAGTLERALAEMADAPHDIARAQRRALRKLLTFIKRRVLRAAAAASGASQKKLQALLRYRATLYTGDNVGIEVWLGTNPLKAHHLGNVTWRRSMQGARVGRRGYPGAWSWSAPAKTAPAVMRRIGQFGRNGNPRLERIDVVREPIHDAVNAAMAQLEPEIERRFQELMLQELNYALNVEQNAA
jgi:hypothetical protein